MSKRIIKIFVYPELLPAYRLNQVHITVRILHGEVDITRIHSKVGYPGDEWVIAEKGVMHGNNIFQRKDTGEAVMKTRTGEVMPVISDHQPNDGTVTSPDDMPKWAAAMTYDLIDVGFPTNAKDLDESDMYNMGIRELPGDGDLKVYQWGNIKVPGTSMRSAFSSQGGLWDLTYNKSGNQPLESTVVTLYKIVKKTL